MCDRRQPGVGKTGLGADYRYVELRCLEEAVHRGRGGRRRSSENIGGEKVSVWMTRQWLWTITNGLVLVILPDTGTAAARSIGHGRGDILPECLLEDGGGIDQVQAIQAVADSDQLILVKIS